MRLREPRAHAMSRVVGLALQVAIRRAGQQPVPRARGDRNSRCIAAGRAIGFPLASTSARAPVKYARAGVVEGSIFDVVGRYGGFLLGKRVVGALFRWPKGLL